MLTETNAQESKDAGPNLWVMDYGDYLYGYACTRIDDKELARDLVQETFLAALQSWGNSMGEVLKKPGLLPS